MKNHMDSKLYDAVIKDNSDVLKEMENKLSINNERTPGDSTVLHLACQYGSIKCVEAILSTVHESFLFKINWRAETGLHLAAREGHYEVVVALIAAAKSLLSSEEPNIINFLKETSTSTDHVQNLIRMPNVELETALHAAVRYGHFDVVNLLVKEDPSHSYSPNKHNETPLYLASVRCHTAIIKVILDNCESPTFGGPAGRTALHAAVLDDGGHGSMKLLLAKKKDHIKAADNYGWTAYHYVAYNNLYKLVEDLVSVDDDDNYCVGYLVDKDYSRTALHVAAYRGNVRVMEELVKYFPDCWEMVDGSGENILHIAVEQGQKEVIKFIMSQGSKANSNLFNQRDSEGNTPLHLISKLGSYVPELFNELAIKVDWEVLNNKDLTPMDVVRSAKETDTLVDQTHFRTPTRSNVEKHRDLWHTLVQEEVTQKLHADIEKGRQQIDLAKNINKKKTEFETAMNSHMIVAALITTVALTAGFAMPGGFDGNQGATQGSAILLRKTAFKAFIVTDAIALLFSISSLFLHFMTTIIIFNNGGTKKGLYGASTLLNIVSIVAMALAFTTGTYAVLAHSPELAITVSVISSLFFLFAFYIFIRLLKFSEKED